MKIFYNLVPLFSVISCCQDTIEWSRSDKASIKENKINQKRPIIPSANFNINTAILSKRNLIY
ncbi:hypothetical protein BpHYR1_048751 [Brachionus plicatilis]|uniref:Lipoprotein n=1 Tax=Brachionus plicatilis TaxID=10195 RepID=A0A3M7Q0D4_BRAPC|nr:hypothetical protein BpHYR1_048751 [Brachionus plicatilis]